MAKVWKKRGLMKKKGASKILGSNAQKFRLVHGRDPGRVRTGKKAGSEIKRYPLRLESFSLWTILGGRGAGEREKKDGVNPKSFLGGVGWGVLVLCLFVFCVVSPQLTISGLISHSIFCGPTTTVNHTSEETQIKDQPVSEIGVTPSISKAIPQRCHVETREGNKS